jgi:hypothetical protein
MVHRYRKSLDRCAARATRALMLVSLGTLALASSAQAQTVPLGTAGSYAVLGATTVTNTGPTVINGDLGVSPGAAVTGFPPGLVNGTIHAGNAAALQAQSDVTTAYNDAAGRACNVSLTGQDLGGLTLTSGVYCFASSAQLTGTVTLNAQGNPNAVFIFQIGSTLTTASNSTVNLINGAQSCNVFWQVGSSATLGTTTTFRGNVLALTSNTAATGATVDGRLLARNGAVTLDSNVVTRAQCSTPPGTPPGTGPGETDATRPVVLIEGAPGDGIPGNPVAGPDPQSRGLPRRPADQADRAEPVLRVDQIRASRRGSAHDPGGRTRPRREPVGADTELQALRSPGAHRPGRLTLAHGSSPEPPPGRQGGGSGHITLAAGAITRCRIEGRSLAAPAAPTRAVTAFPRLARR